MDEFIEKSAEFARPILRHLRKLVHEGCPSVEEAMKWSFPHFMCNGAILCSMAAFKEHASFGFWHQGMHELLKKEGVYVPEGAGSFGRITARSDLPDDKTLLRYVREAVKLNESGEPARPAREKKAAPPAVVPADLAAELRKNKAAAATFEGFSPSHRREYIEWITEAKREETRKKRLDTALGWLAQGKSRNWKYENC